MSNNRRTVRRIIREATTDQPLGIRRPNTYAIHENLFVRQMNEQERRRRHMVTSNTIEPPQSVGLSTDHSSEQFQFALVQFTMATTSSVLTAAEDDINEQCIICINMIQLKETIRVLKCKHKFHKSCIDRWLMSRLQCPICRQNVAASPEFCHLESPESLPPSSPPTVIDLTSPPGSPPDLTPTLTPLPLAVPPESTFDCTASRLPRSSPVHLPLMPPPHCPWWGAGSMQFCPVPMHMALLPSCVYHTLGTPSQLGVLPSHPRPPDNVIMHCPTTLPLWPAQHQSTCSNPFCTAPLTTYMWMPATASSTSDDFLPVFNRHPHSPAHSHFCDIPSHPPEHAPSMIPLTLPTSSLEPGTLNSTFLPSPNMNEEDLLFWFGESRQVILLSKILLAWK